MASFLCILNQELFKMALGLFYVCKPHGDKSEQRSYALHPKYMFIMQYFAR